ncbi:hypothetical protein LZF95_13035 [Algoriphagus sp. AGSA1]|uniref:hypothetical protein n=1 Tax=Algoriphagus sp. AGSA1 TaxID=2907213 RepID=UPI001F34D2B3|nr:hypothetical protein [Algoriphagus sp. AGSA1]MCE7055606.1 hypothetical protein [Algoriphagus sp. AGSA1]
MKKMIIGLLGLFILSLAALPANVAIANPYKIVWQRCAAGSEVDWVIRCRLEGGDECFANWQGFCDEPPEIGG